jgi:hypothetical protein
MLTGEDYAQAVRLEEDLVATGEMIRAWRPWFDELGELMAQINEQQIFEVRRFLSQANGASPISRTFGQGPSRTIPTKDA